MPTINVVRQNRNAIAYYFALSHSESISQSLSRIRKEMADGQWSETIEKNEKELDVVK